MADRPAVLGGDEAHASQCPIDSAHMAEIKKVGVVGGGLMGHGIAQVTATAGYDVVAPRGRPGRRRQVPGQDRQAARPGGGEGQGRRRRTPTRSARASRRRPTTPTSPTATSSSRRSPSRCRSKLEMWREVDGIVKDERVLRDEHVVAGGHRPGRGDDAAGPLPRPALLQPGAGHEARRGHPRGDDVRRGVRGRPRVRASRRASSRSRRRTRRASSSTACSSRTCSTRSAPTRRASARSTRSTRR